MKPHLADSAELVCFTMFTLEVLEASLPLLALSAQLSDKLLTVGRLCFNEEQSDTLLHLLRKTFSLLLVSNCFKE
jgi:hypothetical protein